MRSISWCRVFGRVRILTRALIVVAIVAYWAKSAAAQEGPISEIRAGILYHESAVIVSPGGRERNRVEGSAADVNFELLFKSPDTLEAVGSPRPHIGITANTRGDTSQAYAGLTWSWFLSDRLIFELGGGAAVHDGQTNGPAPNQSEPYTAASGQKLLGCRVLFRGAVALGVRFAERHSVTLALDHISNGYLCEPNPGLDTLGLRWGYRF